MTLSSATLGRPVTSLAHLQAMMVPAGIVQFSRGRVPDIASGTCLDDNVRAWLVAMLALAADPKREIARRIGDAALAFVVRARRSDGRFANMADIRGEFLEDIGSDDSIGRAIWVCGIGARCAPVPEWRDTAVAALEAALPAIGLIGSHNSRSYAALGVAAALAPEAASIVPPPRDAPELAPALRDRLAATLAALADGLDGAYRATASADWRWFNDALTWGNGRLPEALLRAAAATGQRRWADTGLRALQFLGEVTQPDGTFVPIGNEGWYPRGGVRAKYDQQPIEACAMVDAWLAAHRLTGDAPYLERARTASEWFDGRNTERIAVGTPETGGCYDGLKRGLVNRNQGAESTVSYLHSRFVIQRALSE